MKTVLVVDDTRVVRATLARIVRRAGYRVVAAADGVEALRIGLSTDLVAAVVDYQMPGMDGLTLLARLRAVRPHIARVLVSGALDMDVVMDAVNRGEVTRVLHKPFDAERLRGALQEAIESRESLGEAWLADRDEAHRSRGRALEALLSDEVFDLALQPLVEGTTSRTVAFEALLRPRDEAFRSPEEVLEAAERHQRIPALGAAVARAAARLLDEDTIPAPLRLFLNLHPLELQSRADLVAAYLPLVPHADRVVLEITERGPLPASGTWRASIEALREIGFGVAVDDLGSGAASLLALAEIDPDLIKLDSGLVRGVDREPRKARLVQMLCRFAAAVGMEIVAEGVETEAEAAEVRALGVHLLQGYHFARPTADRAAVDRLRRSGSLPVRAPTSSGTRLRAHVLAEQAKRRSGT